MIKELAIGVGCTALGGLLMWGGTLIGAGQEAVTDKAIETTVNKVLAARQAEDTLAIQSAVEAALVIQTADGATTVGAVVIANGRAIAEVKGEVSGLKTGIDLLTRRPGG